MKDDLIMIYHDIRSSSFNEPLVVDVESSFNEPLVFDAESSFNEPLVFDCFFFRGYASTLFILWGVSSSMKWESCS
jgi:hypothetical protein